MTVLVTAAIAAISFTAEGQTGVAAPERPPAPIAAPESQTQVVRVMLSEVRADGSRGSMANTTIGTEPRHLWADGAQCSIGAGSNASFSSGVIAWRITGRIVASPSATATGQQADVYTVEVDAQRVTGPASPATTSAPRTMTLRPEERILIDRATVSGGCGSGELRLEATLGSSTGGIYTGSGSGGRGGAVGRGGGGGRGVGGGTATTGVGRSGGGGAAAAMAGQGTATSSGMGRGVSTGGRGAGGGRGVGAMGVQAGSVLTLRAPEPPIDAELWLVHHVPSGPERVQQLTVRIGSTFTFPAVAVTTPQGPVNVEVSGSIYERLLNGVPDGLSVEIKRRLRGDGPPSIDSTGSSTRQLVMPASEVVSFPIPSYMTEVGTATGGGRGRGAVPSSRLLEGNTFELRLRIKGK